MSKITSEEAEELANTLSSIDDLVNQLWFDEEHEQELSPIVNPIAHTVDAALRKIEEIRDE